MTNDLDFSTADGIADFYRVANDEYLRANMVVSLDGNFVGPSGSSRDLSGPLDLTVLLTIRLLSDVVLVGAKTALGEKYRYTKVRDDLQTVASTNPPFCLVSSTLELPSEAPIFSDPTNHPHIITLDNKDSRWIENLERLAGVANIHVANDLVLDGNAIRNSLRAIGFKKVVCEGGPRLLQTLLESDAIDELALTISPTITGVPATAGALGNTLRNLHLAASTCAEDFVFSRYLFAEAHN